jgi:hypothetical protein
MNETLTIVILIVVALLVLFFIPRFMMMRAISKVISIFLQNSALSDKSAKTIDELGLRPPSFMQRIGRFRDYKPHAVEMLRRADIIQMTEDGRLYLSEEKLALSKLRKR